MDKLTKKGIILNLLVAPIRHTSVWTSVKHLLGAYCLSFEGLLLCIVTDCIQKLV